jgi:hypothetical protein
MAVPSNWMIHPNNSDGMGNQNTIWLEKCHLDKTSDMISEVIQPMQGKHERNQAQHTAQRLRAENGELSEARKQVIILNQPWNKKPQGKLKFCIHGKEQIKITRKQRKPGQKSEVAFSLSLIKQKKWRKEGREGVRDGEKTETKEGRKELMDG